MLKEAWKQHGIRNLSKNSYHCLQVVMKYDI